MDGLAPPPSSNSSIASDSTIFDGSTTIGVSTSTCQINAKSYHCATWGHNSLGDKNINGRLI
jgi:hypothetical protein